MAAPWDDAGAAIDAVFGETVVYTGAGLIAAPVAAIWSDVPGLDFAGAGNTLRRITYEVRQADLPLSPSKADRFTHRGIRWIVADITRRDDIGKWQLVVEDGGPA